MVSIKLDFSAVFPQLVWKSTKEMGAAYANRADGRVVVVVRYSPAGNFNNAYKENVFPERKDSGGVDQAVFHVFFQFCCGCFECLFLKASTKRYFFIRER